jgi:hypothetical protein
MWPSAGYRVADEQTVLGCARCIKKIRQERRNSGHLAGWLDEPGRWALPGGLHAGGVAQLSVRNLRPLGEIEARYSGDRLFNASES